MLLNIGENTMGIRKKHSPALKLKVALEVLQGRSIVDICREYQVAQSLVHKWKDKLRKSGAIIFGESTKPLAQMDWQRERAKLCQRIGEQSLEIDFLKKVLGE